MTAKRFVALILLLHGSMYLLATFTAFRPDSNATIASILFLAALLLLTNERNSNDDDDPRQDH